MRLKTGFENSSTIEIKQVIRMSISGTKIML